MTQFHTLVASDLDGTLLPEGQTELPCAVFDEIRRLHDCGVLFCAASGRPLDALRELFAPYQGKLDEVVLGCTHYPFAAKAISRVLGSGVALLDGGDGTARETRRRLAEAGLLENGTGEVILTNSLPDESILELSRKLLDEK